MPAFKFNTLTGNFDLVASSIADLAEKDHDLLDNLAWSVAGHTIDATVDMVTNDIDNAGDITLKAGKKLIFDG